MTSCEKPHIEIRSSFLYCIFNANVSFLAQLPKGNVRTKLLCPAVGEYIHNRMLLSLEVCCNTAWCKLTPARSLKDERDAGGWDGWAKGWGKGRRGQRKEIGRGGSAKGGHMTQRWNLFVGELNKDAWFSAYNIQSFVRHGRTSCVANHIAPIFIRSLLLRNRIGTLQSQSGHLLSYKRDTLLWFGRQAGSIDVCRG